jgi:hypothetical protein
VARLRAFAEPGPGSILEPDTENKEAPMTRFILSSLALVGTAVFLFVFEGGSPVALLVLSSLLLSLLVPFFAVLAVWRLKDWGGAWKDASGRRGGAAADRGASAALWAFYEKASYSTAVIGVALGAIIVLSNLGTVERLGPPLAAGMTGPLYSALLGLLARILRARVEQGSRA